MSLLAQMPASAPQLPPLPEGPTFDRVRGPIEIPTYETWQIVLAVAVGGLLLGLLIWRLLRARSQAPSFVCPRQSALAELETAARLTENDDQRFAQLSSQALRRYLEEGLGLRFSSRTSEEFLRNLKGDTRFAPEFQEKLAELLRTFDQIKFAQKPASQETRSQITHSVRQLIEQAHAIAQKEGAQA
ncbi:DUF4381 family protein [Coraliomargarita sp. SDUM461003]|uniref:DUF4381 family protein n=1 Tax=Thalassobacterium maritimum TaxID=3041265 RepID=A0ABU1AR13_9BACT|nr:DUF4381 family protein [Coraliomargarita sp. SDUM461003]MDQ8206541.1 DUF4381 family protein [Coraliomargarita sp. SDUM461003]